MFGRRKALQPRIGGPQEQIVWLIALADIKRLVDTTFEHDYNGLQVTRLVEFSALLLDAHSDDLDYGQYRVPLCTQLLGRVKPTVEDSPRYAHSFAFFFMASKLSRVRVNLSTMTLGMSPVSSLIVAGQCLPVCHFTEASKGATEHEDYEALVVHFFDMNFKDSSDDHLQIFIYAIIGLFLDPWAFATSNLVVRALDEMIYIAHAILRRGRRTCYYGHDDAIWLSTIRACIKGLTAPHLQPLFQELFHVLEQCYMAQILVGDQSDIRQSLHRVLEWAHKNTRDWAHEDTLECAAPNCPWIAHRCDGSRRNRYEACPLLDLTLAANTNASPPSSPASIAPHSEASRRSISSMPAGAAEGSGDGPVPLTVPLTPDDDHSVRIAAVGRGSVESHPGRASVEVLPSLNVPDVQRRDTPNSSVHDSVRMIFSPPSPGFVEVRYKSLGITYIIDIPR